MAENTAKRKILQIFSALLPLVCVKKGKIVEKKGKNG
ncbi:hypothetical protein HAPS_0828 [Glaesserella parasuis SH0165]|uniref:Uncharacterized protein n=1 Tax=Glaesserella parasuis serovar 5 (strain SH0165) TaxID=557723 RepID=B8F559_GLAP5|nr:hypothetical protein HAPS_0828 [Glaesserella parasuis SH0165]